MDLIQWIPLAGALGVGSLIGNYVGGGKARREVRSGVLRALAETENTRWAIVGKDASSFSTAARDLETAALIARIPGSAVQQYVLLANAAWRFSVEDFRKKDGDNGAIAGGVHSGLSDVVKGSAEVITELAWRPWWPRVTYKWKLHKLREEAAAIDDEDVKLHLASAQDELGRSSGSLGKLHYQRLSEGN